VASKKDAKKTKTDAPAKSYLPKAGPRSSGGGRGKRRDQSAIDLRNGKRKPLSLSGSGSAGRRTINPATSEQHRQVRFRQQQVAIAFDNKRVAALTGVANDAALKIFVQFPFVEPLKEGDRITKSRTRVAEDVVIDDLGEEFYKANKKAVEHGFRVAKAVLSDAYNTLKVERDTKK
jgi:hypothetical protein